MTRNFFWITDENEIIIHKAKPSITINLLVLFLIYIFSFFVLYGISYIFKNIPIQFKYNQHYLEIYKSFYSILLIMFIIINISLTLKILFFYIFTDYVITNKRVICKRGIIKVAILDIILSKIETVYVVQDIIGRLFNFGTLILVGTGGTKQYIKNVNKPYLFKEKLDKELYKFNLNK